MREKRREGGHARRNVYGIKSRNKQESKMKIDRERLFILSASACLCVCACVWCVRVLPFMLNKIHIVHFYLPFFVWLLLLSMLLLLLLLLLLNLNIFFRVSRNAATQISKRIQ